MSTMNVKHTMVRIKDATKASPIAVFRCGKVGELNVVFAATVKTQQMIVSADPDLIGVYDGSMDFQEIERKLRLSVA